MNHVFKLIWSRNLGMLVPVPEGLTAAARGDRRVRRRIRRLAKKAGVSGVAAASALVLFPLGAAALPTGGQVVAGQAQISQSAGAMQVTQGSAKAILTWQDFGIAPGESVTFRQPSTSSVALNRVLGNNPSAIYGSLNANGQVFLINPNGITFAQGAQVNVGGIVASTLGITNQDFLNGNYHFSGTSDAGVVNAGSVSAADGGYVAFIGRHVDNEGSITTPGGTTALGAGGAVDLTLAGNSLLQFRVSDAALKAAVKNGGAIQASDGRVILSAAAKSALMQTVVNNTGVIKAQGVRSQGGVIQLLGGNSGTTAVSGLVDASAPNGTGGSVVATGQHVVVKHGARVVATGSVGGGKIAIGGGVHGGSNIAQAQTTTVEQGAVLDASATVSGDGGQISIWSDVTTPGSLTQAYGSFMATGGAQGGNGGFIETSGHVLDANGATVDVSAAHGAAGTWLLDPYNLTVTGSGTNSTNSATTGTNTAGNSNSTISASSVNAALATGNVTLQTTGTSGTQAGDITVNGAITWSANTAITLDAAGKIAINAPVTASGTNPTLNIKWDQASTTHLSVPTITAPVTLGSNATLNVSDYAGTNIAVKVITSAAGLKNISNNLSGQYALGQNIDLANFAWNPIGTSNSPFIGRLAGLGHKISNLTISAGSSSNVGLFGVLGSNSSISDVGLINASVKGSINVGALVGINHGSILNSYSSGSVSGSGSVGGLVGGNFGGQIQDSYSSATVSATTFVAGGLAGTNQAASNYGSSSNVTTYIGGIISNSYATGDVSVASAGIGAVGGLVGVNGYYRSRSTIGSQFTGQIINKSYATGAVTGPGYAGGLAGVSFEGAVVSNASASGTVTGSGTNSVGVGGLIGVSGGKTTASHATGTVTGGMDVGGLIGRSGGTIQLTASVAAMMASGGAPVSSSNTLAAGYGLVSNSYASNSVSGAVAVGGLVGGNISGQIDNSYSTSKVSASQFLAGGLAGTNQAYQTSNGYVGGTIRNSYATGDVSVANTGYGVAGGLVGMNGYYTSRSTLGTQLTGLISNSYATGNVQAPLAVGGLVGTSPEGSTIHTSYSSGTVSGSGAAGGLVGISGATITDTYANGSVSGGTNVGGLVGQNGGTYQISNALVALLKSTFGLSGASNTVNVGAGHVLTSYASGAVTGTTAVGGLVGSEGGTGTSVFNSYWSTSGTGQTSNASSTGGTGVSAAQMTQQATFTGFNFTSTNAPWTIYEGHTAPLLTAFMTPLTITASNQSATYSGATVNSLLNESQVAGKAPAGTLFGNSRLIAGINNPYASAVNVGTYTAQLWSDQQGYLISYKTAAPTLTITPKSLSGSIVGTPTKTYDGTKAATLGSSNFALTGFVAGEGASVTQTSGSYASANAGTNDTVTASLSSSNFAANSGTLLSNYSLPTTVSGAGTITKAPLTVSGLSGTGRAYDGTKVDALSGTAAINGLQNGETLTLTNASSGTLASANAGSEAITTSIGLADGTGSNAGLAANYSLTQPTLANVTITKAPLSGSIVGKPTKTYDGTKVATLGSSNFALTGFVAGEGASVTQTSGSYASANAGTNDTVTASLSSSNFAANSGTLLSNYSLPTTVSGAGTITKAPLTVSISGTPTKTYDGTNVATLVASNFSLTGFVSGEGATVTQAVGAYTSADAATNDTVTATLASSNFTADKGTALSNYSLPTSASGAGTISPKKLTATFTDTPSKTYDGTTTATLSANAATTFALSGFITGQGATLANLPTTGAYASANASTSIAVSADMSNVSPTPTGATKLSNYVLPATATDTAFGSIDPLVITLSPTTPLTQQQATALAQTISTVLTAQGPATCSYFSNFMVSVLSANGQKVSITCN